MDVRKYRDDLFAKWFVQLRKCVLTGQRWNELFDILNRFMISSGKTYPIKPTSDRALEIGIQSLVYSNALSRLTIYHTGLFLTYRPPPSNAFVINSGHRLSVVPERTSRVETEDWITLIDKYSVEVQENYNRTMSAQLANEISGRAMEQKSSPVRHKSTSAKSKGTLWSHFLIQLYSIDQFELVDTAASLDGTDLKSMKADRVGAETDLHSVRLLFTEPCGWHSSCRPLIAAIAALLLSRVVTVHPLYSVPWTKWIYQCARYEPHQLFYWLRWWNNTPKDTLLDSKQTPRRISPTRTPTAYEVKMCNDFTRRICGEYMLAMWHSQSDPFSASLTRWAPFEISGDIRRHPVLRLSDFIAFYRSVYPKLDVSSVWNAKTIPIYLALARSELVINAFVRK